MPFTSYPDRNAWTSCGNCVVFVLVAVCQVVGKRRLCFRVVIKGIPCWHEKCRVCPCVSIGVMRLSPACRGGRCAGVGGGNSPLHDPLWRRDLPRGRGRRGWLAGAAWLARWVDNAQWACAVGRFQEQVLSIGSDY